MEKDIIREVRQAEAAKLLAMSRNNAAVLGGLLAEDLVYVHSGGERDTKTKYLASIRDGNLVYAPDLSIEESSIDVIGDEVHVRAKMKGTVTLNGTERKLNTTPLTVWRNVGGTWRLARFEAKPT